MTRERWEQVLFAHVPDEVVQDMLNQYVLELESSNSKLRELVAVGLRCCDFKCDGCRFNKHNACYVGEFEDEARKLGVDVNG